jgi:hypothetical protein
VSFNATRRRFQLKHGDVGAPTEQEAITDCTISVESFVHVGLGMSGARLDDEALADFCGRLDLQSVAAAQGLAIAGQTA